MDALMTSATYVTDLVKIVFDIIVGNPVLSVIVVCGLVTVAVGVFGAIKGAAHL